jgi:YVTN family beta-propeller protein
MEESQRRRIDVSAILEGETMRFTWLDSKALILKSRKELTASLVAAAVVAAAGFAISSASPASAQELSRRPSTAEAAFLKENDATMMKMLHDMAVKPSGDVDHDFVAMMTPHHQGAIDMSEAELRYGHNEQLHRIAQDIVVEELQEIAAMRAASGEKLTPTEATLAASFTVTAAGPGFSSPGPADDVRASLKTERPFLTEDAAAMTKMVNDMTIKPTGNIDRDFVAMMVPHHDGAIDMARAELRYGHEPALRRIAQEIVVDQIQQISLMRLAVGEHLPASVSSPTDPQQSGSQFDCCAPPAADQTPPPVGGQAPFDQPDIPISSHDRVYTADQFSNTVSVVDPSSNTLLGVIRLGDPSPHNFSPLYKGQVLVHGMGFSPDHRTIAVVSIGSNSVAFIDTATNEVKHITYVGRAPHEAFFTPDGKEVWVTVRGENYVDVLDGKTFEEKTRIITPAGPGMQIFSPDGKYGYVCSSFNPETDVVSVATHSIVARVKQASPFCPNIAATPDGSQVWFTLKDTGKTEVFDGKSPFTVLKVLDTGPITNHVNIVHNANGTFAYVTIGGLNEVKVFRTNDFSQVATIPVGALPHGIWPSGDGNRVYVGLENGDGVTAIDTLTNKVIATVPIGQAPQALTYVPDAVPSGSATQNLQSLGVAGQVAHLALAASSSEASNAPTSVSLFDQGLIQVLEAAVSGLQPKQPYVLALAENPDGTGALQPLQSFMTNPAGAAIVNAIGPIRQLVEADVKAQHRYLVIVPATGATLGAPVQVQVL